MSKNTFGFLNPADVGSALMLATANITMYRTPMNPKPRQLHTTVIDPPTTSQLFTETKKERREREREREENKNKSKNKNAE